MATLSRFAFLNALTLGGVFVLTGCGGSTEKNSNYTGAYRSAYNISSLDEVGTFNFTVDTKGDISGLLDNQAGKVREVTGQIESNGSFNASTRDRATNTIGRISGTMSIEPTTIPIGTDVISTPVTGGNFSLIENNTTSAVGFIVGGVVADSDFRAAYSDGGLFDDAVFFGGAGQNTLADSSSAEFSVDRQGILIGTFGGYSVSGQIKNDTRITGEVTDTDGTKYLFTGIANKATYTISVPPTTPGGPPTLRPVPGIKFDLIFTINGKQYNGYVKASGGDGTTNTTTS